MRLEPLISPRRRDRLVLFTQIVAGAALTGYVFALLVYLATALLPEERWESVDLCRAQPEACDQARADMDTRLDNFHTMLAENRRVCMRAVAEGGLSVADFYEFCHNQLDLLDNPHDTFDTHARLRPQFLRQLAAQQNNFSKGP